MSRLDDHLDGPGKLTIFDYEYLKGNEAYWDVKGGAFTVVHEWIQRRGYGDYGQPTEYGSAAMRAFERAQCP